VLVAAQLVRERKGVPDLDVECSAVHAWSALQAGYLDARAARRLTVSRSHSRTGVALSDARPSFT
jgi:hypothetical protein